MRRKNPLRSLALGSLALGSLALGSLALGSLALGSLSCEAALGLDDLVFDRRAGPGGSSAVGGAGGGVAGGGMGGAGGDCSDCEQPGCGGCPPGEDVWVEAPPGPGFFVDAAEVTAARYAAFLETAPSLEGQASACTWNDSFAPGAASDVGLTPQSACNGYDLEFEASVHPDYPIVCVDWCDAAAYCQWRGGELCGRIQSGALAGALPIESSNDLPLLSDPAISAWHRACSAAGERTFPYGDTFTTGACNEASEGQGEVLATRSYPACEGGVVGLFDMSGNAEEWSNECWAPGGEPGHESCARRGGAYYDASSEDLACAGSRFLERAAMAPTTGFRCCTEP